MGEDYAGVGAGEEGAGSGCGPRGREAEPKHGGARALFRALHEGELPLVLPNAWDVASALAFVEAGFPVLGTTSLGVAAARGVPDGGRDSLAASVRLARRLAPLGVPLSVDVEDGGFDAPSEVAGLVAALTETGPHVVGVNIEDSSAGRLVTPAAHAAKVAAVKERAPGIFLNARVDTYWTGQDATPGATLDRARAYVAAGADGIFVPGVAEPSVVRELAGELPVPLNVLPVAGADLRQLAAWGVRRVSTGSLPYRAALRAAVDVAEAVRGGWALPAAEPYAALQDRLAVMPRA
ncbi:isocitrate lyase/phosphoenolpyruvate mutase family protein [Streptomyces sp. NPDC049954]|uniref:isocitrate lyase/PEP mutase family protein n=1 Tax=Streptomyces sp. NPDC049954 TaxID=3155779 RepID=UPI00343F45B3